MEAKGAIGRLKRLQSQATRTFTETEPELMSVGRGDLNPGSSTSTPGETSLGLHFPSHKMRLRVDFKGL